MQSKTILLLFLMFVILLILNSIINPILHPVHIIINIALLTGIVILFFESRKKGSEKYNYDEENPNALISGSPVAGTVYVSNKKDNPGLGWIN